MTRSTSDLASILFLTLKCFATDLERVLCAVRRAAGLVSQLAGQRVPRQRCRCLLHESSAVRQVYDGSAYLRAANARTTRVLEPCRRHCQVAHKRLPVRHAQRPHPAEQFYSLSQSPSTRDSSVADKNKSTLCPKKTLTFLFF